MYLLLILILLNQIVRFIFIIMALCLMVYCFWAKVIDTIFLTQNNVRSLCTLLLFGTLSFKESLYKYGLMTTKVANL